MNLEENEVVRRAVYPGTFDPLTGGHEDLVRRSAQLFDEVILAVADSKSKKPFFTLDERLEIARAVLAPYPNVSVAGFSGLLRDFAVANGAKAIIRGVRAVVDFDYEFQLAGMNRHLMPDVETVFLTPSEKYLFVSGTLIREIASMGGEFERFVHPIVAERLRARAAERR